MMKATDIVQSLDALADSLSAAGLAVTLDPGTVIVPGAWLTVGSILPTFLNGDVDATATLYLIARDTGHIAALLSLGELLQTTLDAVGPVSTVEVDSVALPGHSGQLPAYRLTIELDSHNNDITKA